MTLIPEESTYGDYQDAHNHHPNTPQEPVPMTYQKPFSPQELSNLYELSEKVERAADDYDARLVVAVFDKDDTLPVAWVDYSPGDDFPATTFDIPDWLAEAIADNAAEETDDEMEATS